jgi:hypothetical protein
VRLASRERDPQVHHGEPRAYALLHLGADALFHGRDESPGNDATHRFVHEFETPAAGKRLHVDVADGVLPVPSGLFDVPAVSGRGRCEGFTQWRHHVHGVQFHALVAEPVQDYLDVGLSHAPEDQLVRFGIPLHAEGGISGGDLPQAARQRVLVAA